MKKTYWIIIGISVPLALFGIFVLIITSMIIQINSDSDKWMVELEPHLQMSSDQLFPQIQNEDVGQLKIYKTTSLDRYLNTISSVLNSQFKNSINTDAKFVFYIDKNSKYSKNEIQEILLDIDGIKKVEMLHDWLLNK